MKRIFIIPAILVLAACNNSKKEKTGAVSDATPVEATETSSATDATPPSKTDVSTSTVNYTVGETDHNVHGSVLVQKDKSNISPGNELLAIVTANGSKGESFTFNFAFTPKPGIYPVVGLGFTREKEVYGGILGGKPKLTPYKVNLTQVEDLGENRYGGHKWKISGSVDEDITIDAMKLMTMDKTHPANIKISKISFSNLSFDDNWEKILEEGMKKVKMK